MTPMAEVGGARIKELRAEAIHWYVVSNKAPGETKGVNTTRIERLLDMADGDIDLMTSAGASNDISIYYNNGAGALQISDVRIGGGTVVTTYNQAARETTAIQWQSAIINRQS